MGRYTERYVPPNLGKITFLDGRIKIRNAAEAITVGILAFGVNALLSKFLPAFVSFIVAVIIIVLLGLPALLGVGGEPLSIFILNIINYSNSRTYVTLKPPQREVEGVNIEKPKKENKLESFINRFFTGGGRS